MKLEIKDNFLYIDKEIIPIQFNCGTYFRDMRYVSGLFVGELKKRLVCDSNNLCTRVHGDYGLDKYKNLFTIEGESYSLEMMQDMKALHGIDVEKETNFILHNVNVRLIDNRLNSLFDKEYKLLLVKAKLDKIKEMF